MALDSARLTEKELSETVLKEVTVHLCGRYTKMILGIQELGFAVNRPVMLIANPNSTVRIHIAKIYVTRLNNKFYQVIDDAGDFHLYLPSVIDEDNSVYGVWQNLGDRR